MENPWKEIELDDYEAHMSLESIAQLQALCDIMKSQFNMCNTIHDVMILGVAGGNGLQHIPLQKFQHVYGLDVNEHYLEVCVQRYPRLKHSFTPLCLDLTKDYEALPKVDYVIANLLIEYIGYQAFCNAIAQMNPRYISCVIQVNESDDFVSNSPYIHAFDALSNIHHEIEEASLLHALSKLNYHMVNRSMKQLNNGKSLLRIDFESKA